MNGIERIRIRGIARREPFRVRRNASCPLPSNRSLCPGRMDRKLSSFGAPRKIEGMKSMNVWVMDMATMKVAREIRENCWK